MHPVDRLLVLHYLLCDVPLCASGEWITFRQFPGGQFYWEPFCDRTVRPLVEEIGDDLALLRRRLDRFDWSPVVAGDVGAAVRVVGKMQVAVVYRRGDEEFPAGAEILFDSSLKQVYWTEDAAAVAGRVCRGLRENPCAPCGGCGLCDTRPTRETETKRSVP